MAFAFDEAWIYGGQLSSCRRNYVPEGLGKCDDKVTHSLYIQGMFGHIGGTICETGQVYF